MGNYKQVQFISWELYTGPLRDKSNNGIGYAGINNSTVANKTDVVSQVQDIEARLLFTNAALTAAYEKANPSSDVLKVFMAPEFLFRGSAGAYLYDLLNGWEKASPFPALDPKKYNAWPGLLGLLKGEVVANNYNDWVFVFGTAIGASYENDTKTINLSADAEAYNVALAQNGGSTNTANTFCGRKHYKSGIDFIKSRTMAFNNSNIVDQMVSHFDAQNDEPVPNTTLFNFHNVTVNNKPINFGIEICLDHAVSTSANNVQNNFGRVKATGSKVNIQLVPSGGMSLKANSIWLDPATDSYAFNCDGLINCAGTAYGAHTEVSGANATNIQNSSTDAAGQGQTVVKIPNVINNIDSTHLWSNGSNVAGAGSVRLMAPLALN